MMKVDVLIASTSSSTYSVYPVHVKYSTYIICLILPQFNEVLLLFLCSSEVQKKLLFCNYIARHSESRTCVPSGLRCVHSLVAVCTGLLYTAPILDKCIFE